MNTYVVNCIDPYGEVEESYSYSDLADALRMIQEQYKHFEEIKLLKEMPINITVIAELA